MLQEACQVQISSFDLSKAITFSRFFSKVKLSPSARLVLRCLIDFWNPKKGLVYPGQDVIAECTGVSPRSITNAVEELRKAGLILTTKKINHLNYHFTRKFFELVEIADNNSKNCYDQSAEIADTCNKQNKEQINNQENKILNFSGKKSYYNNYSNQQNEPKHLSVETTKKILAEKNSVKCGSPLDFTKEQAINYLDDLPEFLNNSFFAKELRKKWNL